MSDTTDIVEALSSGKVIEVDQNGRFQLTDSFENAVSRFETEFEGLDNTERIDTVVDHVEQLKLAESLVHTCEGHPKLLASYLALRGHLEEFSHDEVLPIYCSLDQFRPNPPPIEGVPGPFLPIHGDHLEAYTGLFEKSLVYVWLDDCDPCDLLKEDFEVLFETPSTTIALFAVYGPDASRYLQERFDVVGGPTTLFMHGNQVWMRHQGAVRRAVLETDLEKFHELSVEP